MKNLHPVLKNSVRYLILTLFSLLLTAPFTNHCRAVERTDLSGTVTYNGNPVCAMVLANGKHMFTCSGDGSFELTDVPFDSNDEITLYVFCSGLAPYKAMLSDGATGMNVELSAGTGQQPVVDVAFIVESDSKTGWVDISGTIEKEGGTPLCAMVLANGQYMFTCNPVGEFALTVPLDGNGNIKLYGFCSGLLPYKETIDFDSWENAPLTPIPDTGQTTSYTDTFGEDSDYIINPHSYTKLDASGNALGSDATDWAMVKDNVTGLIWEVKTDDDGIHDGANSYTWQDAQDIFIAQLNSDAFGGYSDWRLPSIMELSMLIHSEIFTPTIDPTYFPEAAGSSYWSSTVYVDNTDSIWCGNFNNSIVWTEDKLESWSGVRVRAVRGGKTGLDSHYVDNGDNTVTDLNTGLMWQKTGTSDIAWEEALTYCENLELAGYDDWRMPSRNELQSIVDYSVSEPAINTSYFPEAMSSWYWSSTTDMAGTGYACCVHFRRGHVDYSVKSGTQYVRAVRGGQQ